MAAIGGNSAKNASTVYPIYQHFFGAADMAAFAWQPALRAMGRVQLDLVHLRSRQARSLMQWGAEMMRPASPFDIWAANARLWEALAEEAVEFNSLVVAALTGTIEPPSNVLPLPEKKRHDTLVLVDRDADGDAQDEDSDDQAAERRVA
jgi:hypothetical protein